MLAALVIAYAVSATLLMVMRQFLRPIMFLALLSYSVGTIGTTVYLGSTQPGVAHCCAPAASCRAGGSTADKFDGCPTGMWAVALIAPAMPLRYLYQHRTSFELQITVYQVCLLCGKCARVDPCPCHHPNVA